MATYPLPTLAAQVTAAGISAPPYEDILGSLKASYQSIFGSDAYLEPDSQDGQLLAIFAQAIHDCNQATIDAYNSFSPNTAQGIGLSNMVKINHMKRAVPTKSQVLLTVSGVVGTIISGGIAADAQGHQWLLPDEVVIPGDGDIVVTGTAEEDGAITAAIGTVTQIRTPTLGWQSVTNLTAAAIGEPVESDADLRRRQIQAPALNSYSTLSGMEAALAALEGVSYVRIYENDTGSTDPDGVPEHSVAVVIEGGIASEIAQTILDKKGPGVNTYGAITAQAIDISGVEKDIHYSVPTAVPIKMGISLEAAAGYTTTIADEIKQACADYVNALPVGQNVIITRLYLPANLNGAPDSFEYELTAVTAALLAGVLGTTDIPIAFTSRATLATTNVVITVI